MDDAAVGAGKAAWDRPINGIRFDEGIEVTLTLLKRSGDVLLTAEMDGVEIGTVRFDLKTVQDVEDALVFL